MKKIFVGIFCTLVFGDLFGQILKTELPQCQICNENENLVWVGDFEQINVSNFHHLINFKLNNHYLLNTPDLFYWDDNHENETLFFRWLTSDSFTDAEYNHYSIGLWRKNCFVDPNHQQGIPYPYTHDNSYVGLYGSTGSFIDSTPKEAICLPLCNSLIAGNTYELTFKTASTTGPNSCQSYVLIYLSDIPPCPQNSELAWNTCASQPDIDWLININVGNNITWHDVSYCFTVDQSLSNKNYIIFTGGLNGPDYFLLDDIKLKKVISNSSNLSETFCVFDSPVQLNECNPTGGYFSGTGVIGGNTFSPSVAGVGTHLITYNVDYLGCNATTTIPIVVENCNGESEYICTNCIGTFAPEPGGKYTVSAWVKEQADPDPTVFTHTYDNAVLKVLYYNYAFDNIDALELFNPIGEEVLYAKGKIIDDWQRIEEEINIPFETRTIVIQLANTSDATEVYFDDIRIHPFNSNMKSYVYDPDLGRLMAEMDENNYSTFYEYDEDGALIRVKKETDRGIMTIQEARSILKKQE